MPHANQSLGQSAKVGGKVSLLLEEEEEDEKEEV